jgi:hypothetical protein
MIWLLIKVPIDDERIQQDVQIFKQAFLISGETIKSISVGSETKKRYIHITPYILSLCPARYIVVSNIAAKMN